MLAPTRASFANFQQLGTRARGASVAVRVLISPVRHTLRYHAAPGHQVHHDVFLCGQVLDYRPASPIALVDDMDLIQEPGCSYICMIDIRGYRREHHQVVAIPLVDASSHLISWDEFVVGFYHGLPATLQPPARLDTAWQYFYSSPADRASVRAQLG
jgi:hypothetical protein